MFAAKFPQLVSPCVLSLADKFLFFTQKQSQQSKVGRFQLLRFQLEASSWGFQVNKDQYLRKRLKTLIKTKIFTSHSFWLVRNSNCSTKLGHIFEKNWGKNTDTADNGIFSSVWSCGHNSHIIELEETFLRMAQD